MENQSLGNEVLNYMGTEDREKITEVPQDTELVQDLYVGSLMLLERPIPYRLRFLPT